MITSSFMITSITK